jgi:hypothetical protein
MATSRERGYGSVHRQRRKALEPLVAAGRAACWRCGQPIVPGEPWDLGHDDDDRTRYRGAEHRACNRATYDRRRVNLVDLAGYPEDHPEDGVFWGPPELDGGRPRRWSRAWSDWRDRA